MDLEDTEARNDYAGEDQQWPAGRSPAGKNVSMEAEDIVGIRHQETIEDMAKWENFRCAVVTVICEVCRTATA
jgi:hypothetical protein